MKFTLNWLKDHLETDARLDAMVETLSMIGLEVESVDDRAAALKPFTVAHVKEAKQHPDADRLKVCIVDTGSETVQVVCGAPNARTGMYGVFAPVGSYIPGTDMTLKAGKIRGVESNGMLVSEREMGISEDHEGIIDLEAHGHTGDALNIGAGFAALLGLDDPVVDVGITPNRGDCLGVRGIARDLAAAGLGTLKPLNAPKIDGGFDSPLVWQRDLPADRQDACPYVAGRYFRGVKNGPSPRWMQDRLLAIGLRPISALVDITNYVTHDLGRPLHVFDADKVTGNPTMRFARDGETIEALDGRTYTLDGGMVVIADDNSVEGIGGVMGGEPSGCTETTTNVFLEVALFDPVMVATTGRRLGILSDARYRFERGVDPESAIWGPEVAARLVQELCGGETSHVVSAGEIPRTGREIELRESRVGSLGGVPVPAKEQVRILSDLGFTVEQKGHELICGVPSWRPDVEGEACLVEEVLRIHGFDHLPQTSLVLDTTLPLPALSPRQRLESAARMALAWSGLNETVTFSFLAERDARRFGWSSDTLRLVNPISADLDVMRPSAVPNLIDAARRNADRGVGDAALFEVGPTYRGDRPEDQRLVVAAVRAGSTGPRHWDAAARAVDLFDAKGDALAVLESCGAPVRNLQITPDAPDWYHPGRSGVLRLGPNELAHFGELHPRILRAFDLKGPVVAAEIFLDAIPEPKAKAKGKLRPALDVSAFQPVSRDFAFVVAGDVPADKVARAAAGADKGMISQVNVFDVYQGKGLAEDQKSIAVTVTLQPTEKTLTEDEIEAIADKIVASVAKHTGGTLRS